MARSVDEVGAGRGDTPESGNGGELYVVIGHAPRHLDRNIATVGRVLQGMELLSVMPRGTGPLGFYESEEERTPIPRVRMAADVPASERVNLQALRTDSATFRAVIESRRGHPGAEAPQALDVAVMLAVGRERRTVAAWWWIGWHFLADPTRSYGL